MHRPDGNRAGRIVSQGAASACADHAARVARVAPVVHLQV